jgi:hypothetical protein
LWVSYDGNGQLAAIEQFLCKHEAMDKAKLHFTNLQPADLKRKMKAERLQRILAEGAVLNVEGGNWLIDFWGRKDVAGILLMPVTQHQLVHINESIRLKKKCQA